MVMTDGMSGTISAAPQSGMTQVGKSEQRSECETGIMLYRALEVITA